MQSPQKQHISPPGVSSNKFRRISEPAMPVSCMTSQLGSSPVGQVSSTTPGQNLPTYNFNRSPLVLTPVSQLSHAPRRLSRSEAPPGDRPANWDPELHNPDGSLRTVHTLPSFDQSYGQAISARYIRRRNQTEGEKELTVEEIFHKDLNP